MAEAEILSWKLRRYRKMNGLNQFEAASEIGLSTETLSKIERCQTDAKLSTVSRIAAYMGITVSTLLAEDGENEVQE